MGEEALFAVPSLTAVSRQARIGPDGKGVFPWEGRLALAAVAAERFLRAPVYSASFSYDACR